MKPKFLSTTVALSVVFVLARAGVLPLEAVDLEPAVRGGVNCTHSDQNDNNPCLTLPGWNGDPCSDTYYLAEAIEGQTLDFLAETVDQCLSDGCSNVRKDKRKTSQAYTCDHVNPPPADPGM